MLKRAASIIMPALLLGGCQSFPDLPSASYSEELEPASCQGIVDNYELTQCELRQRELQREWSANRRAERNKRREEAEQDTAETSSP